MLTIIVDTREQRPWCWDGNPNITTETGTLRTGDYSVAGLTDQIAVERKSLDDLTRTMLQGRSRWHAELRRLTQMDTACVIVEASFGDLALGRYRSRANPRSLVPMVIGIHTDFGIPVFFADNRPLAQIFAGKWLERAARRLQRSA